MFWRTLEVPGDGVWFGTYQRIVGVTVLIPEDMVFYSGRSKDPIGVVVVVQLWY